MTWPNKTIYHEIYVANPIVSLCICTKVLWTLSGNNTSKVIFSHHPCLHKVNSCFSELRTRVLMRLGVLTCRDCINVFLIKQKGMLKRYKRWKLSSFYVCTYKLQSYPLTITSSFIKLVHVFITFYVNIKQYYCLLKQLKSSLI